MPPHLPARKRPDHIAMWLQRLGALITAARLLPALNAQEPIKAAEQLCCREAEMLAVWAEQHSSSGLLHVQKLWLFDNRLGDSGAVALAPLFHIGLLEVRLSERWVWPLRCLLFPQQS